MENYEVVDAVIGRGNFGVVNLVKSIKEDKLYVMKVIDLNELPKSQREGALQEVKLLARLRHPFIVSYRESFLGNNSLHIVMHYCEGGDLGTRIQSVDGEHFSEEQVLDWFVQIALALQHCHHRKIIHRDLKSQNIFLTKKGNIRLGDFGIARVLNGTSELAMSVVGTPYSMSPEVCEGKAYSYKSDIWALGCVLYEMCVLKPAFDANNLLGLVWKIVQETYPPIPKIYSNQLRQLIGSMLKKDAADRPSIDDILEQQFVHKRLHAQVLVRTNELRSSKNKKAGSDAGGSEAGGGGANGACGSVTGKGGGGGGGGGGSSGRGSSSSGSRKKSDDKKSARPESRESRSLNSKDRVLLNRRKKREKEIATRTAMLNKASAGVAKTRTKARQRKKEEFLESTPKAGASGNHEEAKFEDEIEDEVMVEDDGAIDDIPEDISKLEITAPPPPTSAVPVAVAKARVNRDDERPIQASGKYVFDDEKMTMFDEEVMEEDDDDGDEYEDDFERFPDEDMEEDKAVVSALKRAGRARRRKGNKGGKKGIGRPSSTSGASTPSSRNASTPTHRGVTTPSSAAAGRMAIPSMQSKCAAIQSRCLRKMTEPEFKEIYTFFQKKQQKQSAQGLGAGDTHTRLTQNSLHSQFGKMNSELIFAVEQLVFLESLMAQQQSGGGGGRSGRASNSATPSSNRRTPSSPGKSGSSRPITSKLDLTGDGSSSASRGASPPRSMRSRSSTPKEGSCSANLNGARTSLKSRGSTPKAGASGIPTPKASLSTPKTGRTSSRKSSSSSSSRSSSSSSSSRSSSSSSRSSAASSSSRSATPKNRAS